MLTPPPPPPPPFPPFCEQGKWRSLQQLLDALQRKRFSIIPGAMRLVAECLEGIATDYPLDFLHYVTHLPLDPEPEVLGDVDAFDVMLPSVLLCGSSHRCPKGIWDAKLQQYSRSNAHGDWDGDSGVVPDAFAPPGKARKTVRRASTERRSSAEITPGSRETASDVVGMRRGSCCGPAAGNMRRRTCCDSAAGKHRTASLTRATAAAVSVARHSHSCDRLPSTRTSEKRRGSAAGAVEQLNKPTPSAGLRQLQTVHSSSFMESEQGGGANEPSSPVTGDDLPPTPVEKVVEMGYTKVSRGGLQACRVPLENFAGVMQAADGNDSHAVSLLQLVVDAVDTTLDYSVFGARLMQMLVEFKWHGFAKDAFQRTLFWYVVHMIVVIVFNLHAAFTLDWSMDDVLGRSAYSDDLGNAAESPDGYVHGRPNVLLLLGLAWTSVQCVHTGLNEIWQLRVSGRRAYFRSFWNHFDLLYVFGQGAINVIFCLRDSVPTWLIIDFAPNATEAADAEAATSRRRLFLRGSSALHGWHDAAPYRYDDDPYGRTPTHPLRLLRAASSNTAGSEDGETGYAIGAFVYLQSLVCLGICIRLIHFFRGSLRLGALAHTLGAIAVDILPLLSLLAVFVVAFCLATMVVLIHECTSEVYGEWHNPFDALLVMLNIGLYTYYNSSVFKPERRFLLLIYQFYMILVQVILLNMLIAVMSESHNRVTTQAELVALHGRAKLILEYETEELERQKSHKERRGGTGATVGATALRGWMARLDPRQLLDDTAQEERMQRVCPRWLHVLMPAEHQRGDKAVEGEELKQLKELRARVEGVADDLGAQQRQLLDALSKHDPQEQQQQLAKQLASLREDLLGAPGPTGGTPAPGSLGRRQSYVLGV